MLQGSLSRMQLFGIFLCGASFFSALVLLVGILRRSYWALAVPVLVGSLGALYIAFWIGRSLIVFSRERVPQETAGRRV